jgi:hypothetical protein
MSLKMRPNGPCHCGSEKRFKKCCRNSKNMKEPAKLAGQIFNQWIEKDLEKVFVKWPRLIYNRKNVITDEDIDAWTPVTIYPVHYVSVGNSLYPANLEAMRFKPGRAITLTENVEDVAVQIGASPKIMREHQFGHVVVENDHPNVFLYHAGMYSLMYVSHKFIPKGTVIVGGPTCTTFREDFEKNNSEVLASIEYHYLECIRRFLVMYTASDSWSEEHNTVLKEIYKKLSDI